MKEVTISARIPEELSKQITTLAQGLQHNRSWVIKEALRGYIASEKQFLAAVEEGIAEVQAGKVVPHDVVMQEINALLTKYPDSSQ